MLGPPEGFAEAAQGKRTAELAEMYGKSVHTIRNWCHAMGIIPERLSGGRRFGQKDTLRLADSPERVKLCLNCDVPADRCTGGCAKVLEIV